MDEPQQSPAAGDETAPPLKTRLADNAMAVGVAVGLTIGVLVGMVFNAVSTFLFLGFLLGLIIGALLRKFFDRQQTDDPTAS